MRVRCRVRISLTMLMSGMSVVAVQKKHMSVVGARGQAEN